jgi:rhodanese-related sulfurtransferase
MVSIRKLFTPVESIDSDQVKAFMEKNAEGTYNLLDVRQPGEYEQEHLPGSKLIPLPDLDQALSKLDPEKPTIVY